MFSKYILKFIAVDNGDKQNVVDNNLRAWTG